MSLQKYIQNIDYSTKTTRHQKVQKESLHQIHNGEIFSKVW